MKNKIDKILDDLAQCTGTGKWDKHYLEVVEEIRGELIKMTTPTYKQARKIIEKNGEYIINNSLTCELAHQYTVDECIDKDIQIDKYGINEEEDGTYTPEAQAIFDKHYKLITETLGV